MVEIDFGNPLDDEFFTRWVDEEKTTQLFIGYALFLVILLAVILPLPSVSGTALIYFGYLIVGLVAIWWDFQFPDSKIATLDFAGDSINRAILALLTGIGCSIFYILVIYPILTKAAISAPSISTGAVVFGISGTWLFVVLVAPFDEELFYRMFLFPWIRQYVNNYIAMEYVAGIIAGFIQAIAFGWAHMAATGGATNSMLELAFFGFIAGNLNYLCKSSMAGVGFHLMRNIVAVQSMPSS